MKTSAAALKELRELNDGLDDDIQYGWGRIRTLYEKKNSGGVQRNVWSLVSILRSKGILLYLIDADRTAFFERCYHAALLNEYGNRLIKAGMPHDPNMYSVATTRGFFDALLTFNRSEYLRYLRTAPDRMHDEDDAVPFLFNLFLMELAEGKPEGCAETLRSMRKEATKGEEAEIEIELCESLLNKEPPRFVSAMGGYLERRQGQIDEHDDVPLGEEYISVEGLALRRLAAHAGVEVQIKHPLTPTDLQENYPDTLSPPSELPAVDPEIDRPGYWAGWKAVQPW